MIWTCSCHAYFIPYNLYFIEKTLRWFFFYENHNAGLVSSNKQLSDADGILKFARNNVLNALNHLSRREWEYLLDHLTLSVVILVEANHWNIDPYLSHNVMVLLFTKKSFTGVCLRFIACQKMSMWWTWKCFVNLSQRCIISIVPETHCPTS